MSESQRCRSADGTFCQLQVIITTSRATPQQQQQIAVSMARQEQPQQFLGRGNYKNDQQLIDLIPQQLSHCSFSNDFKQQQQQQQQQQALIEISTQVLPPIQRMPTYNIVNIVSPLQPRPTNRQRQRAQQNANNNFNGCSSIGTGHLTLSMPPAITVVGNETRRNVNATDNETKISYKAEVKQIP
ncbi:uncharacterized protein ACN427_010712 isoform 1-T2 [Glossina fuscipes fuscipes]